MINFYFYFVRKGVLAYLIHYIHVPFDFVFGTSGQPKHDMRCVKTKTKTNDHYDSILILPLFISGTHLYDFKKGLAVVMNKFMHGSLVHVQK